MDTRAAIALHSSLRARNVYLPFRLGITSSSTTSRLGQFVNMQQQRLNLAPLLAAALVIFRWMVTMVDGAPSLAYVQYLRPSWAPGPPAPAVPEARDANSVAQDSPIYYIRLPPQPYVFVPGLGYVSQPPPAATAASAPGFVQVPLSFLANGKPTSVYQWQSLGAPTHQQPQAPPRRPSTSSSTNSNRVTLDRGPYVFNGKPSDIYVLRDALYADALQNFYP